MKIVPEMNYLMQIDPTHMLYDTFLNSGPYHLCQPPIDEYEEWLNCSQYEDAKGG